MRNDQVSRFLKLIQLLSNRSRGFTVSQLVSELGVTRRTIYRDLEGLQAANFPIYSEMDGEAYWRFIDGYTQKTPLPFTLDELMGLYFAQGMVRHLEHTHFKESLNAAFKKIRSGLSDEALQFVTRASELFHAGIKGRVSYKNQASILSLVNQALTQHHTLHIRYRSFSSKQTTTRKVNPYHLYYYEGSLYLIGFCHKAQEVRTFAIERILLANKTNKTFKIPASFCMADYFKDSFGVFRQELTEVTLWFNHTVADFVLSKTWHPSQTAETDDDGCVTLTLKLAGTREIKAWIMGFANHAAVIKPKFLRDEILDDLDKMTRVYQRAGTAKNQLKLFLSRR